MLLFIDGSQLFKPCLITTSGIWESGKPEIWPQGNEL